MGLLTEDEKPQYKEHKYFRKHYFNFDAALGNPPERTVRLNPLVGLKFYKIGGNLFGGFDFMGL